MAPYYESLCKSLDWPVDTDLLNKMKKANEDELKRLEDELEDAEKNLGESEIRDAMMAKAEYLCRIGDKVSEGFKPGFSFSDVHIEKDIKYALKLRAMHGFWILC